MRGLIIVLFMIVSSFAQDNYSKKDIEKMIAKMVVLGFTGTSIDKNSQIYKESEFKKQFPAFTNYKNWVK